MEAITDEMEGSDVVARDVKVCLILSGQDYMTQVVQPITILFCIWKVMKYDSPTREPESVQDKTVIFAESFVAVTIIHYHTVMGDPNFVMLHSEMKCYFKAIILFHSDRCQIYSIMKIII